MQVPLFFLVRGGMRRSTTLPEEMLRPRCAARYALAWVKPWRAIPTGCTRFHQLSGASKRRVIYEVTGTSQPPISGGPLRLLHHCLWLSWERILVDNFMLQEMLALCLHFKTSQRS